MLLVLAAATATAFFRLGAKGFWGDEIWTLTWSRYQPPLETFWSFQTPPDLPLNFVLTELASAFGTSESVVRLPEALMAIATVGLVYAIGQWYVSRAVAVVAALLLAVAAYHVWYAQDARPYSPLAFYAVLSLVGVLRLIEKPGLAGAAVFVVGAVLGIYNHLFGLFPFASEAVFVALWGMAVVALAHRRPDSPNRRHVARVWLAFVASSLVVVLLCWPLAGPIRNYLQAGGGNGAGGTLTFGQFDLSFAFLADLFGRFGFGVGWRFVPVALLCLLGIVASFRWRWWLPLLGMVWLAFPLVALWIAQPHHGFEARYVLFLQPLYLFFVGVGVVTLAGYLAGGLRLAIARVSRPCPPRLANVVALVLAGGLIGLFLRPTIASYWIEKQQDWQVICGYLHGNVKTGDLVTGDDYFYDALLICPNWDLGVSVVPAGRYSFSELAATGRRVWFVYIPTQPLESALEQAGFVAVARADWEQPGMHEVSYYTALPFPFTETHADLYRLDPQPRSRVEFHDIEGSAVSSGWPDYVNVVANSPVSVPICVPPTSAEDVLRVWYLAYPGRDLVVVVSGQELARIDTSQGDGGWHPIDIPLPAGLSGMIMVEFRATGGIAAVSVVEIVDRAP